MATTVYFARHGEVENSNSVVYGPEAQLSETGESQMEKLAQAFTDRGISIDVIVCSPLLRASESARIVRDNLGNKPEIVSNAGFAPVATPGWYGKPLSELNAAGPADVFSRLDWCEETPVQVVDRLGKAFVELCKTHKGTVLLIGHQVELGMFKDRLEHPLEEPEIRLFDIQKGEALAVLVGDSGEVTFGEIVGTTGALEKER